MLILVFFHRYRIDTVQTSIRYDLAVELEFKVKGLNPFTLVPSTTTDVILWTVESRIFADKHYTLTTSSSLDDQIEMIYIVITSTITSDDS